MSCIGFAPNCRAQPMPRGGTIWRVVCSAESGGAMRRRKAHRLCSALFISTAIAAAGCATLRGPNIEHPLDTNQRVRMSQRAHIWAPTDIPSMNVRLGPQGTGTFLPEETVVCHYIDESHEGNSPKFTCALGNDDRVKV